MGKRNKAKQRRVEVLSEPNPELFSPTKSRERKKKGKRREAVRRNRHQHFKKALSQQSPGFRAQLRSRVRVDSKKERSRRVREKYEHSVVMREEFKPKLSHRVVTKLHFQLDADVSCHFAEQQDEVERNLEFSYPSPQRRSAETELKLVDCGRSPSSIADLAAWRNAVKQKEWHNENVEALYRTLYPTESSDWGVFGRSVDAESVKSLLLRCLPRSATASQFRLDATPAAPPPPAVNFKFLFSVISTLGYENEYRPSTGLDVLRCVHGSFPRQRRALADALLAAACDFVQRERDAAAAGGGSGDAASDSSQAQQGGAGAGGSGGSGSGEEGGGAEGDGLAPGHGRRLPALLLMLLRESSTEMAELQARAHTLSSRAAARRSGYGSGAGSESESGGEGGASGCDDPPSPVAGDRGDFGGDSGGGGSMHRKAAAVERGFRALGARLAVLQRALAVLCKASALVGQGVDTRGGDLAHIRFNPGVMDGLSGSGGDGFGGGSGFGDGGGGGGEEEGEVGLLDGGAVVGTMHHTLMACAQCLVRTAPAAAPSLLTQLLRAWPTVCARKQIAFLRLFTQVLVATPPIALCVPPPSGGGAVGGGGGGGAGFCGPPPLRRSVVAVFRRIGAAMAAPQADVSRQALTLLNNMYVLCTLVAPQPRVATVMKEATLAVCDHHWHAGLREMGEQQYDLLLDYS